MAMTMAKPPGHSDGSRPRSLRRQEGDDELTVVLGRYLALDRLLAGRRRLGSRKPRPEESPTGTWGEATGLECLTPDFTRPQSRGAVLTFCGKPVAISGQGNNSIVWRLHLRAYPPYSLKGGRGICPATGASRRKPMTEFTYHGAESAPEAAKPLLEKSLARDKSITQSARRHGQGTATPGGLSAGGGSLRQDLADRPGTADRAAVDRPRERCRYCMAAHSAIANLKKMPAGILSAKDGIHVAAPLDFGHSSHHLDEDVRRLGPDLPGLVDKAVRS